MKNALLLFLLLLVWTACLPFLRTERTEPEYTVSEDYVLSALAYIGSDAAGEQALKALAVAIRSYTALHGEVLPTADEAYIASQTGEAAASEIYSLMSAAVSDTCGEYLTCGGKPVNAVWHLSSRGKTASDSACSCLRSVSTPDESAFPSFHTRKELTDTDMLLLLPDGVQSVSYGADGRAVSVKSGRNEISAEEFMLLTGIPSNDFTVKYTPDGYIIDSYGSGNGIGMSLYGAYLMAESGCDYTEILYHYYSGAVITRMTE